MIFLCCTPRSCSVGALSLCGLVASLRPERPGCGGRINKHDGRTNGGYGVKNNFKLDENGQYQYTEPAEKN